VFRGLFKTSEPQSAQAERPKVKPAPRRRPSVPTVLGTDTKFVGTLTSGGDVRLEDMFVGDIRAKGRVDLGRSARLDGDLICERATVGGLIKGDITARQISVLDTGRVLGDMRMEKLTTEEGAFLQGLIKLEDRVDTEAEIKVSTDPLKGVTAPATLPQTVAERQKKNA
jgi:cytoskeletal protein CcmA (bactofilin family)